MGAMSLVFWAGRDGLAGPVGAGIAGSAAYGVVQIWLVGVWLVKAPIWPVAPLILGPGVLAGGITGLVALAALWRIRRGAEEWYRALA